MTNKEYQKQWRDANKEKIKLRQREWQSRNKDKHAEYQRKWREKNPDKYKAIEERAHAKQQTKPMIQWEITLSNRMKQYVLAKSENEALNRYRSCDWAGKYGVQSIKEYCVMPERHRKN